MYIEQIGGGPQVLGQIRYTGPQIQGEGSPATAKGEHRLRIGADWGPTDFVWVNSPWGFVRYWKAGFLLDPDTGQPVATLMERRVRGVQEYEVDGVPHIQEFFTPLTEPLHDYVRRTGHQYLEVQGTTVVSPVDGKTYLVADTFKGVSYRPPPPEPITIEGTLSTWSPLGVAQVWPKVGGYVVSSSQAYPTEAGAAWARAWNAGELALGSLIRMDGYPLDVRGRPGIVPLDYRILEAGTGPPGEGVDLPEIEPPDEEEDDNGDDNGDDWQPPPPPVIPNGDNGDNGDNGNGPPPGNGNGPPPGNGNGAPTDKGEPLFAGFGGAGGVIVLGLLLLPFLRRKK